MLKTSVDWELPKANLCAITLTEHKNTSAEPGTTFQSLITKRCFFKKPHFCSQPVVAHILEILLGFRERIEQVDSTFIVLAYCNLVFYTKVK